MGRGALNRLRLLWRSVYRASRLPVPRVNFFQSPNLNLDLNLNLNRYTRACLKTVFGSTGDPPAPSGDSPDGMGATVRANGDGLFQGCSLHFRSARFAAQTASLSVSAEIDASATILQSAAVCAAPAAARRNRQ